MDLRTHDVKVRPLEEKLIRELVGGLALAYYLAVDAARGDDCSVAIAPGSLTGVAPWAPKTSMVAVDASKGMACAGVVGGLLGFKLKRAGIGALVLRGPADHLHYVLVGEDHVKVVDATYMRGAYALDVVSYFKERYPGSSVLAVGPMAEEGVERACAIVDGTGVGCRCGLGSYVARVGLKALVVALPPPSPPSCLSTCPCGCCLLEVVGGKGYEYLRVAAPPMLALSPPDLLVHIVHLSNQLSIDYVPLLEVASSRARKGDLRAIAALCIEALRGLRAEESSMLSDAHSVALASLGLCAKSKIRLERACELLSRVLGAKITVSHLLSLYLKVKEVSRCPGG